MKRWLISIEVQAVYFYPDGSSRRNAPFQSVSVIDKHPALYIFEARQELHELQSKGSHPANEMPPRADDILAIFSAIEIPDGLLTEDQIDRLS